MWLFKTPSNYSEMRSKIANSVFLITLIELFVLAQASTSFSQIILQLSFIKSFKVADVELYLAYVYIPILFAALENIFNLHDYLQKPFHIREAFEGTVMLAKYADCLGMGKIRYRVAYKAYKWCPRLRKEFMKHFYTYASSTDSKIDKHYVVNALDSWCWFWIVWDSLFISVIMVILGKGLSLFFDIYVSKKFILFMILLLFLLIGLELLIIKECKKRAEIEIYMVFQYIKENGKEDETAKSIKKLLTNALSH